MKQIKGENFCNCKSGRVKTKCGAKVIKVLYISSAILEHFDRKPKNISHFWGTNNNFVDFSCIY